MDEEKRGEETKDGRRRSTTRSKREGGKGQGKGATTKKRKTCIALEALLPEEEGHENMNIEQKKEEEKVKNQPYSGDWSASSWNGQGLLASEAMKQHSKMRRARELSRAHDITGLQETHGRTGKMEAVRAIPGTRMFWSNGAEGEAGVGLWIKQAFIDRVCGPGNVGEFIEVEKGRGAIWRGGGKDGKFQISVVYLHTGNSVGTRERQRTLQKVMDEMAKYGTAMSILLGDFNFVTNLEDRMGGEEKKFTGGSDNAEAKQWQEMLKKMNMEELEQHQYTYRFEETRSRIDWIYTIIRPFEKLDRDIGCVALDWKDHLSGIGLWLDLKGHPSQRM